MSLQDLHKLWDFSKIKPAPDMRDSSVATRISRLTMPTGALERFLRPYARIMAGKEPWLPFHSGGEKLRFSSVIFAADHEIVTKIHVSAYPQEVTRQMLLNFIRGGAAQSVLAKKRGARLYVTDVGVTQTLQASVDLERECAKHSNVTFVDRHTPTLTGQVPLFVHGCRDPRFGSSLTSEAFETAFRSGQEVVRQALEETDPHVFIFGEMGIGNSTCSAAIAEVLVSSFEALTGAGTGVSTAQKEEKAQAIRRMRQRFEGLGISAHNEPFMLLQELGGFEHAALAGAICEAAAQKRFVLIDGLIVTSALAPLLLKSEALKSWIIAGHRGSEPAHIALLEFFKLEPLLDLGLRLGEGSGAALAAGLLQDAEELVSCMATFESAVIAGPTSLSVTP